jgi:NADPH:quinone reductase-like Zn-dependent oxidoreductase
MLPVNPFTAAGLLDGVAAGAWVVQNAATSAVARIVTRLAKKRGIRTISVVRNEARSDELREAGADAVLVDGPELAGRVREVTGAPVVRALDAVAGEAAGRLFECVSEGGELVCYGLLEGDRVVLPAAQLVFRDVRVRGFSRLRSFGAMELAHRRAIEAELLELFAAGVLETEIEATYPLEEVAAALQHQLRPGRRGKIVLVS